MYVGPKSVFYFLQPTFFKLLSAGVTVRQMDGYNKADLGHHEKQEIDLYCHLFGVNIGSHHEAHVYAI